MRSLITIFIVLAFSIPAFAFEVYKSDDMAFEFYGSLRMYGAYSEVNGDKTTSAGVKTNNDVETSIPFMLQNNSRYGFKFKVDKLSGTIELSANNESGNTDIGRYRLMFAAYSFDHGGKLAVGKMSLPGTSQNGNVFRNDDMGGFGAITTARRSAISYSIYGIDLYVISMDSYNETLTELGSTGTGFSTKLENNIPMINIAYNLPKAVRGKVYGSFLTTDIVNRKADLKTTTNALAWHVAAYVVPKFGDFSVSVSAYYGVNMAFSGNGSNGFRAPLVTKDSDGLLSSIRDAKSVGFLVAPNYNITNAISTEVGFGWANTTIDKEGRDIKNTERSTMSIYGNAKYRFNKNVRLAIQVMYNTVETVSATNAKSSTNTLLAGGQLRFDF